MQVYAWGGNNMGQLGLGDSKDRRAPTQVDGLWAMPVQQLAAGDEHSAALTASGFLFTWGCNDKGQLGLPARAEQAVQVSPAKGLRWSCQGALSVLPRGSQGLRCLQQQRAAS